MIKEQLTKNQNSLHYLLNPKQNESLSSTKHFVALKQNSIVVFFYTTVTGDLYISKNQKQNE